MTNSIKAMVRINGIWLNICSDCGLKLQKLVILATTRLFCNMNILSKLDKAVLKVSKHYRISCNIIYTLNLQGGFSELNKLIKDAGHQK